MRRTLRVTSRFFQLSILLLIFGIVRLAWVSHSGVQSSPATTRPDRSDTLGILACTWGALGIPVCLWLLWMFRRAARRAADILSGANRLAQWTCSAEEWDRYVLVIARRSKKTQRLLLVIFGFTLMVTLGIFVFVIVTIKGPIDAGILLMVLGIMIGIVLLLFLLCWIPAVYLPARLLRNPSSRDVYIGTGGLVSAGRFTSWEMMGASIKSVRHEPADPGTILFRWSQPGAGIYGMSGPMEALVPVPRAHDADARQVVEFFSHRFKSEV